MTHCPSSGFLLHFHRAIAQGRLEYPTCAHCTRPMAYAQRLCRCGHCDVHWVPATGRAVVKALTVYHRAYSDAFVPPYAVAKVQLEEGAQLTVWIPQVEELPTVGSRVRLEPAPDGRLAVRLDGATT